ncbi:Hypothetical predicted protein [Mytilus galloprovincialis]|uniref:Uncharacterized protein n=1 Tax=Mytilus galloprovincialis TaxID=29158 RepID=A0A8B6F052_MYTGA|nr:Hypothetical predicted protein [Mytilus galloprovincialis]
MQLFVLVFCILYSAVFSESVSKRSDNEGKDSPLIWLILKQLNSLGARIEKLQDIAIENQKNIASLKSNNGNSAINKDDVNFKVIAVKNKKKIDDLMEKRYTGGGMFHHPGRPAEPVCLPTNPNFVKTSGTNVAFIYGAEYANNFFASNSVHQDVPCSVCHVQFGTTIMIPGKTRCHKGWKLQYKGNLAAGHSGHGGASTYLCVDFNQQYMHGGSANKNGYMLFDVVGQCGSLPCPPYHNAYPLTCAVCSK